MASIYAGYTTLTLPGWERFAPEVKAPANYKDPVKIQAFIEDAKKRQAMDASGKVLTGALADLAVCDNKGEVHKMSVSEFISLFPSPGNRLVCYRPFNLLRFVVAQLIGAGKSPAAWMVRSETFGNALLGNEEVSIFDPVRAVIGHEADDEANLLAFVTRFSIKVEAPAGAEAMAFLAMKTGQMLGV
jgi:hypothetical protein